MKLSAVLFSVLATLTLAGPLLPEEYETFEDFTAIQARALDSKKFCVAAPRGGTECGVTGTVEHPNVGITIRKVTLASCENACTCYSGGLCHAISWRENTKLKVKGRGPCRLYYSHLDEMDFHPGTSPNGLRYWDRTCFKKATTTKTVQTTLTPRATPPPTRRDAALNDEVLRAMAI